MPKPDNNKNNMKEEIECFEYMMDDLSSYSLSLKHYIEVFGSEIIL